MKYNNISKYFLEEFGTTKDEYMDKFASNEMDFENTVCSRHSHTCGFYFDLGFDFGNLDRHSRIGKQTG